MSCYTTPPPWLVWSGDNPHVFSITLLFFVFREAKMELLVPTLVKVMSSSTTRPDTDARH